MEERRSIQYTFTGLPQWLSGKESACQCSRRVWTLVREDPKCYGAAEVCAPQQENPPQWEAHAPQPKSSPCSLQLEKSQHTATKTQHNHKQIKKKKDTFRSKSQEFMTRRGHSPEEVWAFWLLFLRGPGGRVQPFPTGRILFLLPLFGPNVPWPRCLSLHLTPPACFRIIS